MSDRTRANMRKIVQGHEKKHKKQQSHVEVIGGQRHFYRAN
jgi:NAD(P)H-hydrate repair Nnr-like enzyme with NAD(P)H-hydrate dehydratase domain